MAQEVIKTILALFRIRQLMEIEKRAKDLVKAADAMTEIMNGEPPRYEDSRAPDGDDFNTLYMYVSALKDVVS
ncbi:hypothetical protein I6F34_01330 [Bradyrhizobium sp. BRP05]|nr:hypothetical protein [Bradyrhizobium sp. BRP05]